MLCAYLPILIIFCQYYPYYVFFLLQPTSKTLHAVCVVIMEILHQFTSHISSQLCSILFVRGKILCVLSNIHSGQFFSQNIFIIFDFTFQANLMHKQSHITTHFGYESCLKTTVTNSLREKLLQAAGLLKCSL